MPTAWNDLSDRLSAALNLATAPIAITFSDAAPDGRRPVRPSAARRRSTTAAPAASPPAACSGTTRPSRRSRTVKADHGNCSVGSLTHGFVTLDEVAGNGDVAALLETGWVTMDVVPQIPVVTETPGAVTYGPLAESPIDPDVVLLRVNGKQLMVLSDAIPGLRVEGKPQCHIVAIAKEQGEIAASVGCALSACAPACPPPR